MAKYGFKRGGLVGKLGQEISVLPGCLMQHRQPGRPLPKLIMSEQRIFSEQGKKVPYCRRGLSSVFPHLICLRKPFLTA
jgi:hypothetical protein